MCLRTHIIVGGCPPEIGLNGATVGKQIVTDHIVGNKLIDNHICDKPATDIIR